MKIIYTTLIGLGYVSKESNNKYTVEFLLGKLNFYDGSLWHSHYIVDHYKHDSKFYSGYYEGRYITNASCYGKEHIKFLKKRPLIDLITKRKE